MTAGVKNTPIEEVTLREDIITYLKSPNPNSLGKIYTGLGKRGSQSLDIGPLVIGGTRNSTGLGGGIEIDSRTRLSDLG